MPATDCGLFKSRNSERRQAAVNGVAAILRWGALFLIALFVAIGAAILGFEEVATWAAVAARVLFVVFMVVSVLTLLRGRGGPPAI
jgi:uncharacterized membrane protein YtjA (UPF0391 family)